jgi:hypothetical protein
MAEIKEMVSQDYRFKILQDAYNRADKMKVKINDQFAQGGWEQCVQRFHHRSGDIPQCVC